MRLGISDTAYALDCAQALAEAGVDELVVHGRTKQDGYRPLVRWEWIARIREALRIPVIANGEVLTLDEYHAIRAESGSANVLMLGRGAVADPLLATRIRTLLAGADATDGDADWAPHSRSAVPLLEPRAGQGGAASRPRPAQAMGGADAA